MRDRLYIATVCRDWADLARRYGVGVELDQFCMAENMDRPKKQETCRQIEVLLQRAFLRNPLGGPAESARRTDLNGPVDPALKRRLTFHAPFNELHPAAIDPRAKALARQRLEQAAALALEFGARRMIVHSGYMPFVYFEEWQVDRSVEFWTEFMADKPSDFQIVIENVLESAPDMLVELMERLGKSHPDIRLCLDVGHANCMSDLPAEKWLERMLPWLGHLHIHNNDGSHDWHGPLDQGTAAMEEILRVFMQKGPRDATVALEVLEPESSLAWLEAKGFLR